MVPVQEEVTAACIEELAFLCQAGQYHIPQHHFVELSSCSLVRTISNGD